MSRNRAQAAAAANYAEQEILNETPLARVARVYEMTGLELRRARSALEAGDIRAKGEAVHRACRLLSFLQCCLDVEQGDAVARNLDRLYSYLQHRISLAHFHNSDEMFEEACAHVAELSSAWREAATRHRDIPASSEPRPLAVAESRP